MVAIALGFVGVISWAVTERIQKNRYRGQVAEAKAKDTTQNRKIHEAGLKALPDDELAKTTGTTFIPEGAQAIFSGYLLTREQNIGCNGCLKFQDEYEPNLTTAYSLKMVAEEDRDKAVRGKRTWRTIALIGTAVVGTLIIERIADKRSKNK
ncbi:hypothetical protein LCGC14_1718810 [marine sediment metagenome]|uniref:Uncharacterized protein n=1 Tax=marine sediment metagenome TaxID=412755 RepID=A0A0F9HCV1_9ZZZZ